MGGEVLEVEEDLTCGSRTSVEWERWNEKGNLVYTNIRPL
jgi:hypothetical protein